MSISDSVNNESLNPPTVHHDKISTASYLPTIATYNMRSFFPKVGNVKNDLLERGISLSFFSEVWQKLDNKDHNYEIEKMLEIEGLRYISTPRPRGWGGAAIIVNQEHFQLEKLNIFIPHKLEVVWGLMRCKNENAKFETNFSLFILFSTPFKEEPKTDWPPGEYPAYALY